MHLVIEAPQSPCAQISLDNMMTVFALATWIMTLFDISTPTYEADLANTIRNLDAAAHALPQKVSKQRLMALNDLSHWVAERPIDEQTSLMFICTHNSRRSHMGQIWGQAAAWVYGLEDVRTYSGGTEATQFNPRAIRALRQLGVDISEKNDGRHQVQLQTTRPAFEVFSKVFTDDANPSDDFAAIMTCSDADEACPVVYGAAVRFALPYDDPKASDGSLEEASTYQARAMEIGAEMFYVMKRVAELRRAS